MTSVSVGEVYQTNSSGVFTVVRVDGWNKIYVQFEDGYITRTSKQKLFKGAIRNPYSRSVCGIGFVGEGKYSTKDSDGKPLLQYRLWTSMFSRCYNENEQKREFGAPYIGCTINEEWHNFQNFAEWCVHQKGFGEPNWQLDKDILKKGNREYGPEFCRFVPRELNTAIIFASKSGRSLPLGVRKETTEKKFRCVMSVDGKSKIIGRFYTAEAAFEYYKLKKEEQIKNKAMRYKGIVCDEIFEALMNWEVSVDD